MSTVLEVMLESANDLGTSDDDDEDEFVQVNGPPFSGLSLSMQVPGFWALSVGLDFCRNGVGVGP
jgi:hypothetical protein